MNQPHTDARKSPAAATPAEILQGVWLGTCARYTVLCLLLLLVSAIVSDSLTVTYIEPIRFFLLLPFAGFLKLATMTRKAASLATGAKCALHPLLVMGGFYLCCYLPFQVASNPSGQQVLLLLLLAALVYALFMGIFLLITHSLGRKKKADTPYVSQYGNVNRQ